MTCMDCFDTSPPPHPMIPNTFILPHLIFSITPSLSTHFTPFLPHWPWVNLQSSILTPRAHPSINSVRVFLVLIVVAYM
jgi:hypothetical protein